MTSPISSHGTIPYRGQFLDTQPIDLEIKIEEPPPIDEIPVCYFKQPKRRRTFSKFNAEDRRALSYKKTCFRTEKQCTLCLKIQTSLWHVDAKQNTFTCCANCHKSPPSIKQKCTICLKTKTHRYTYWYLDPKTRTLTCCCSCRRDLRYNIGKTTVLPDTIPLVEQAARPNPTPSGAGQERSEELSSFKEQVLPSNQKTEANPDNREMIKAREPSDLSAAYLFGSEYRELTFLM